jgi:hypothetical protein
MVISAYQSVDKRSKEGTNSVASQHRSLLLQSSDPTDNPRVAFRRDLLQQLQVYCRGGIEFLPVRNFNDEYGSDTDGISSMAGSLGLINLMAHMYPNQPNPVIYAREVKCLDDALLGNPVSSGFYSSGRLLSI